MIRSAAWHQSLRRLSLAGAAAALLLGWSSGGLDARAKIGELKAGWYPWDPYQFETLRQDVPVLEGLDVQLIRSALKPVGYSVAHVSSTLDQHLEGLKTGALDLASGMTYTTERAAYAWFSDPYRTETDVLIVPRNSARSLPARSVADLFRAIGANKEFRVGVVRGFHYGPDADAFLRDPTHASQIRYSSSDNESLERLLDGSLEGFLSDRLVADTLAWRADVSDRVEEHPVPLFATDIRVMFSKVSCTEDLVRTFNGSLRKMRESGEYDRISRHYLVPLLLRITLDRPWFAALGVIGTIAFALSGVLLARKEHYSIFGAFVLSALPAVGGGALRDLLTERHPIGILRTAQSLYLVIVVVVVAAVLYKIRDVRGHRSSVAGGVTERGVAVSMAVEFFDAIGLSAFTVTGVVIAIEQHCEPLWLWGALLAVLTGAGGGILRDIVRSDPDSSNLKRGFYAEIAVIWGFLLSMFLGWETSRLGLREIGVGVGITMLGTLLTRAAVVWYGFQGWNLGPRRS